ncbi:MAG: FAD-dependent pyridine nucleotide-disulfide oxidoreductase [Actinotalea sp.]|nr:FAD-dependent pyridine nucleotide-disulfide oxidoreductase [Actinotalea sp.]
MSTPSPSHGSASEQVTVVVGAGLTAGTAVTTLREHGYAGRIVLVGDELHAPYERPPLSKAFLQGDAKRDSLDVHPLRWYPEHDVELRLGTRVTAIDRDARVVVLADGDRLPWTTLLLATGSSPRRLTVPGADLAGVHTLRSVDDAERIVAALARRPRVVVVGGGWIGLETAAVARSAGLDVTVLEAGERPLQRVLGPELAQLFLELHQDHGVDVRTGVGVVELTGDDAGRVTGVRLADGDLVPADLVLVGIGITPNTALAAEAGLEVDNGIVVDQHLRTSDPDVLAAGDVAAAWHPSLGRRLRVEHWANAGRQGEVAARTILGVDAVDERLPYFYTDQYDLGMEYVGHAETSGPEAYDHVVVRGDLAGRTLIAFWLRESRVVAGMNVNVWDVTEEIEALIRSGRAVDPARLADEAVPLAEI